MNYRFTAAIAAALIALSSCTPAPAPDAAPAADTTPAPAPESATPPAGTALTDKAVAVVDQLVTRQYGPVIAQFDATMTAAMPESLLATTMTQLQQQAGAFQRRAETRQASEGGYDVVYVTCVFANITLNAQIVYNDQGQISGLFFKPA
jgi:hypothetical protein